VLLVSALGVVFCGFAGAGGASAKLITVGSPLTASFTSHEFGQAETVMNSALGETGAQVTSPISGSIIRWHITLATGGPFFLRALTPEICCSGYVGSGSLSAGEVPVSTATQTYKTDLPIEKGDFIGLDNSNGSDTIGLASVSGSVLSSFAPPVPNTNSGGTATNHPDEEVSFNAVIEPPPTVTRVRPRSGLSKGGEKVTIRGTNFYGAKEVLFSAGAQGDGGTKIGKKLKVVSATKIVVVAPAHRLEGVHVLVLDPGGITGVGRASKFKYKRSA
jgi:hypothetical protein